MRIRESLKFINAFYDFINNKINLNDLNNIIYSYKFKLIGFKFHKELPNGNNYIRIKSLENDKVYKLTI